MEEMGMVEKWMPAFEVWSAVTRLRQGYGGQAWRRFQTRDLARVLARRAGSRRRRAAPGRRTPNRFAGGVRRA